jgi:uncharacterized caspase-like protein
MGKWLRRQAKEEDTVLIFYAGHGAFEKREGYWVTYNADGNDLYSTALSHKKIVDMLHRLHSQRLVLFLDSCYTITTLQQEDRDHVIQGEVPWENFSGNRRVIISASDGKQLSLELEEQQHGVFTYYLLDGLKGNADKNRNGLITLDEIWNYVNVQVLEVARTNAAIQTPQLQGSLDVEFPLAFHIPSLQKTLLEKQRETDKTRITELYQAGKISEKQFKKALNLIETDTKDQILEDFLSKKLSLELFREIF